VLFICRIIQLVSHCHEEFTSDFDHLHESIISGTLETFYLNLGEDPIHSRLRIFVVYVNSGRGTDFGRCPLQLLEHRGTILSYMFSVFLLTHAFVILNFDSSVLNEA
jgi:hypothetical protein